MIRFHDKKRILSLIGFVLGAVLLIGSLSCLAVGLIRIFSPADGALVRTSEIFFRESSPDDYDEEYRYCDILYTTEDGVYSHTVRHLTEDLSTSPAPDRISCSVCLAPDGAYAVFENIPGNPAPTEEEISDALRASRAEREKGLLNFSMALFLASVGFFLMAVFGKFFSAYERIWFVSILVLAALFAVLFPEEDCNGVNGLVIMALYLADTFLNILCELLISKQSKWNFIVSLFVEITEILLCLVLATRFSTMAVTLFFWIPVDTVSFINWHRHPDRDREELTEVRRLHGWQEALILAGIAVWTVGIGTLLSNLDIMTDLFGGNRSLETVVCYLDACASAVGIANGLFILFRYREQWIAWYIEALLETVINILSGQFVLLILKIGYLTNTTYGYISWTKYINAAQKRDNVPAKAQEPQGNAGEE